jgi:UDPglucose 6-dehydrogenase
VDRAAQLFNHRFPGRTIVKLTAEEAESIKYIINCFLATKVIFFNEIRLGYCEKYGLDYDRVMGQVMGDGRIAYSHTQVPGHDGDFGFGGTCFPKDICALIDQMEKQGFDPKLLKAAWAQNLSLRKRRDWEE